MRVVSKRGLGGEEFSVVTVFCRRRHELRIVPGRSAGLLVVNDRVMEW
jgi:hypothetical protein